MRRPSLRSGQRGGVLLDAIVGLSLILLGAFALDRMGFHFATILAGARQFFSG
jgi:hypothetical protein